MIEWIIPLSIIGLIILGMQIKNYRYPSQIQKELTKEFNKQWEQIKMTEKRFKISFDNNQNIYDKEEKCYYSSIDAEKLCDLLNDIEQEARDNEHYHSEVLRLYEAVSEENEQLKKQIRQLQHWNKCLAEKRHQELSYRPYTASKSEKELKELLEPKLLNCSDNIKSDRYD